MVKITMTKKWEFEIPKNCRECPAHYSERDGNFSIDFCRLKNYNETIRLNEYKRDDKCPLVDGCSYTI